MMFVVDGYDTHGSGVWLHPRFLRHERPTMEQRKITLSHVMMTPQAARTILLYERYERQRPLDQSVVQEYALAMVNGEFRQGTVISFCVLKDKDERYLVNGQHTLEAICRSGVTLQLGIEDIQVESLEERAYWFSKYDRLKLRS